MGKWLTSEPVVALGGSLTATGARSRNSVNFGIFKIGRPKGD